MSTSRINRTAPAVCQVPDAELLAVGRAVRYKPGSGTYGYEDLVEADGRIPATVTGFGKPRTGNRAARGPMVKIEFFRGGTPLRRGVDAASLEAV